MYFYMLAALLTCVGCRSEGIQQKLTSKNNPLALGVYLPPPDHTQASAPTQPPTPMPDRSEYIELTPTWNPLALSPSPNLFAWLSDPVFRGVRIKFAERSDLDDGTRPSRFTLQFKEMVDDQTVMVQDGTVSRQVPLSTLSTFRPTRAGDWVVPISGDHQGKIFKVRTYSDQRCTVREDGRRLSKNETDISVPTSELVEIFPPLRGFSANRA